MHTTSRQTMDQTVVIEAIREQLKYYQANYQEFQTLEQFLQPLKGKSLGRMEKQLGEMGLKLSSEGDKITVVFKSSGNEHPVYSSDNRKVDLNTFKELDSFFGRISREKAEQLQALLDNPEKLEKFVWVYSTMKNAYADLKEAYHSLEKDGVLHSFDNPAYGPVLEKTGVPYDVRRFIK